MFTMLKALSFQWCQQAIGSKVMTLCTHFHNMRRWNNRGHNYFELIFNSDQGRKKYIITLRLEWWRIHLFKKIIVTPYLSYYGKHVLLKLNLWLSFEWCSRIFFIVAVILVNDFYALWLHLGAQLNFHVYMIYWFCFYHVQSYKTRRCKDLSHENPRRSLKVLSSFLPTNANSLNGIGAYP